MEIIATRLVRDEGTICVFEGETDEGEVVRFGVDHRIARDLYYLLSLEWPVGVFVEEWQILG